MRSKHKSWITGVAATGLCATALGVLAADDPPRNASHKLTRWVINSGDDVAAEAPSAGLRMTQVSVGEIQSEGIVSNANFCLTLGFVPGDPQCGTTCDYIFFHHLKYKPGKGLLLSRVGLRRGAYAGWTVEVKCIGPNGSARIASGVTTNHSRAKIKFPSEESGMYTAMVTRIQDPRGDDVCVGDFEPRTVLVP